MHPFIYRKWTYLIKWQMKIERIRTLYWAKTEPKLNIYISAYKRVNQCTISALYTETKWNLHTKNSWNLRIFVKMHSSQFLIRQVARNVSFIFALLLIFAHFCSRSFSLSLCIFQFHFKEQLVGEYWIGSFVTIVMRIHKSFGISNEKI